MISAHDYLNRCLDWAPGTELRLREVPVNFHVPPPHFWGGNSKSSVIEHFSCLQRATVIRTLARPDRNGDVSCACFNARGEQTVRFSHAPARYLERINPNV